MKLSIFPTANPHPIGPEEKKLVTYQVSRPNLPHTSEFSDEDSLIELVTKYAWSPFVFSGYRLADNFISCDLLVYDIDDGLTIDDAKLKVEAANLACLCLPTPSHSDELHKFRLIIPLAKTIYSPEIYEATWNEGAKLFGTVDPSCRDLARYFNGSTMDDGFWNEGELFEPIEPPAISPEPDSRQFVNSVLKPVSGDMKELVRSIYGEDRTVVPEAVEFFLRNAHTSLPGEWINALNRFCFSLSLSGIDEAAIISLCESLAPNELDKKDKYQINRAIHDGRKAREEEI
jgi:hypothetical protein